MLVVDGPVLLTYFVPLHVLGEQVVHQDFDCFLVFARVQVLNHVHALLLADQPFADFDHGFLEVRVRLERELCAQVGLEEPADGLDGFLLLEVELFLDLVAEDFAEEQHQVVCFGVLADHRDDGSGPVDHEALEAVLLGEVGVHVLLHGLAHEAGAQVLRVEVFLAGHHVSDGVAQLVHRERLDALHPDQGVLLVFLRELEVRLGRGSASLGATSSRLS